MRLSVIIPALNEADSIAETVRIALAGGAHEVIVADGGSTDGTGEKASSAGAKVIASRPGRAVQMNAGAAEAFGDTLLFLHSDTRLPENYAKHIEATLSRPGVVAGAFRLRIDSPRSSLRLIEYLANFRAGSMGLPYGDQGIFIRKRTFEDVGRYPEQPIMEDYELMRRLGPSGRVVAIADACAVTSARRWERLGVLRTTVINQLVIIGYRLGVEPEQLRALYSRNKGV